MPPNVEDWAKLLNGVLGKPGARPGRGSAEDLKRGQAEQQAVDVGSGDRLVGWDGAGAMGAWVEWASAGMSSETTPAAPRARGVQDPQAFSRSPRHGRHSRHWRIETVSR